MQIKVGYELVYELPQPTPMILALNIHYSRASSIVVPDHMRTQPVVPISSFRDGFGNWCNRLVAPQGHFRISADAIVNDNGLLDPVVPEAQEHAVEQLPEETLVFLQGSRYCETDRLSELAWKMFSGGPRGWARVQRVCDFVHEHIQFGYEYADPTKTAWDAFHQRRGSVVISRTSLSRSAAASTFLLGIAPAT